MLAPSENSNVSKVRRNCLNEEERKGEDRNALKSEWESGVPKQQDNHLFQPVFQIAARVRLRKSQPQGGSAKEARVKNTGEQKSQRFRWLVGRNTDYQEGIEMLNWINPRSSGSTVNGIKIWDR